MALSSQNTPSKPGSSGSRRDDADEHLEVRNDVDHVAQVSRTAAGEPHQNPGFELIGLPKDATEEQKAAAENRPVKRSKGSEAKEPKGSDEKDAKG